MSTSTSPGQIQPGPAATDPAAVRRYALAGGIGTMLEQFDFAAYGLASALVLGTVFFPKVDPLAGALYAFAAYAVGFFARPLGGIVFSHFGERHGRKWVLVITLFIMGSATFLIGCLPGYNTIGMFAPILLVVLRLLQGLGAGAEQAGGATLLTESAPHGKRGRLASFVMVGAAAGTAFGTLLFALLQFVFGQEVFVAWAWRIVFWLSALVTVAAFVIRRKLDESPVFEEIKENAANRKAQAAPLKVAFTQGWPRILKVFLMNWGQNTQSYIVQTFFVTFVTTMVFLPGTATHFPKSTITDIQLIGALFGMFTAFMWGRVSDKFGRKRPYLVVAGLCVVLPFVYFPIMETGKSWLVLIAVLLGYLTAAYGAVGIQMSYFPELFGSRYRYAGMTLARELSTPIGGGIAPFVCTALLAKFHMWLPLAIYMAVAGIIAFASACTVPETANRDLTLLNDARPGEAQLSKK